MIYMCGLDKNACSMVYVPRCGCLLAYMKRQEGISGEYTASVLSKLTSFVIHWTD